jgi:predicted dehydrogenase
MDGATRTGMLKYRYMKIGHTEAVMKLGVGLYGTNGHQIFEQARCNPDVELAAAAGIPDGTVEALRREYPGLHCYPTLEDMLGDGRVRLVSLCSPVRRRQAAEAVLCMKAGKHVYAEKPCAMSPEELNLLMETARECGVRFHEMAGTAFGEPYRTMCGIVRSGRLGTVVQVLAQKSYPYHARRPQDEDVDGGLLCQAGIHALRMVEHVAGARIAEIAAVETKLGNPDPGGGLRMASSFMMRLEGGGIASAIANYLNPEGFGLWGNETLRIFGTKGFVEAVDGGSRTRLVVGGDDLGELEIEPGAKDYFDLIVQSIAGGGLAPMPMEDELHPALAVLKARESANNAGAFYTVQ